jgi:hypothetical protein
MTKAAPAVGALMVGLSVVGGAEAKLVRYDIDGQSYSYSTNNHEQTAVARERMAAAKAAADARAKAQAEASANPLVRAFGSQAQRDAAAADARLREVLARNAPPQAAPASVEVRRAAPPREAAKAEPKTPERPTRVARGAAQDPLDTGSLERQTPARAAQSTRGARSAPAAPNVDAIVYDFASGIKTIHMADGSVDEDVFDRAMAASLKRAQRSGGPRVSFVNEDSAAPEQTRDAAKR